MIQLANIWESFSHAAAHNKKKCKKVMMTASMTKQHQG